MMTRAHRQLTAWLGILAMSLIVLVPVISQLVCAARIDDTVATAFCSAMQAADTHVLSAGHADPLAACGYCDLLADQMVLPTVPAGVLPLVAMIVFAAVAVLSIRFTPPWVFPSGRPRAPPVFRPI